MFYSKTHDQSECTNKKKINVQSEIYLWTSQTYFWVHHRRKLIKNFYFILFLSVHAVPQLMGVLRVHGTPKGTFRRVSTRPPEGHHPGEIRGFPVGRKSMRLKIADSKQFWQVKKKSPLNIVHNPKLSLKLGEKRCWCWIIWKTNTIGCFFAFIHFYITRY